MWHHLFPSLSIYEKDDKNKKRMYSTDHYFCGLIDIYLLLGRKLQN